MMDFKTKTSLLATATGISIKKIRKVYRHQPIYVLDGDLEKGVIKLKEENLRLLSLKNYYVQRLEEIRQLELAEIFRDFPRRLQPEEGEISEEDLYSLPHLAPSEEGSEETES